MSTVFSLQCNKLQRDGDQLHGTTAFEFVHNQVRQAIGGFNPSSPGYMATFSYSAFDPKLFVPPLPLPFLLSPLTPISWLAIGD